MGINFQKIVLGTFALGSGLAALAGVFNGLYYNEINFSMGLLLGVVGFSSAVVGGLVVFWGNYWWLFVCSSSNNWSYLVQYTLLQGCVCLCCYYRRNGMASHGTVG